MKKRLIPAILCFILFFSCFGSFTAAAASYQGASSWAVPELDKAESYGLITDRVKGNMANNITREEFAEIAVKLYETYTGKTAEGGGTAFSDTRNPEIVKAANLGLVTGMGGSQFGPSLLVTREQMATILLRMLKVINPTADFSSDGAAKFNDDNQLSPWAKDGVYYCSKMGILKGMGGNQFGPGSNSTREAAVIVCSRAYELYKQAPGSTGAVQSTQSGAVTQGVSSFSFDAFKKSVEALDSYSRKVVLVTAEQTTGQKTESHKEYAYVKKPLSTYYKVVYPETESYLEEILIGDKAWNRMTPDEEWTVWDSYEAENPVAFRYDDATPSYSILYEKLALIKMATERINGISCDKYSVSGTYQDEVFLAKSPKRAYPVKHTATGELWVSNDGPAKGILVRQRITVDSEADFDGNRIMLSDLIEDDITGINSTVVQPPVK